MKEWFWIKDRKTYRAAGALAVGNWLLAISCYLIFNNFNKGYGQLPRPFDEGETLHH